MMDMFCKLFLAIIAVSFTGPIFAGKRQSAELVIRAKVPRYCVFDVDKKPITEGIKLDQVGQHKAHIANIALDCNVSAGYNIIAKSENSFKFKSDELMGFEIPYELVIPGLGQAKDGGPDSKKFTPEVSGKARVYEVYSSYSIIDVVSGEFSDNISFILDME